MRFLVLLTFWSVSTMRASSRSLASWLAVGFEYRGVYYAWIVRRYRFSFFFVKNS